MTRNTKISVGLSVLAAVGVGITALIAHKRSEVYKTKKTEKLKEKKEGEELSKKEQTIIFFESEWPTLVSGTLTVGAIAGAQVLGLKEIAALTGACTFLATKYNDLNDKLQEKFPEEYKAVKEAIVGDKLKEAEKEKKVSVTKDGKELYFEPVSQQFFEADPSAILDAERTLADIVNDDGLATISDLLSIFKIYDKSIQLMPWHETLGWSPFDDTFCDAARSAYSGNSSFVRINPITKWITTENGEQIKCNVITYNVDPYESPGTECWAE